MKKTADVVIIGGGVAGISALFNLVKCGITNVALIEMKTIGSGTTSYSAAYVCVQEPDLFVTKMSQYSFPEFLAFQDMFGINLGKLDKGSISIDVEENKKFMLNRAGQQNSIGVKTTILEPNEIARIAPFLNNSDLGPGLLCELGGSIDPHILMREYVKYSISKGAYVYENLLATGLLIESGKIKGVVTTQGIISANCVVNAAGIYANKIASWACISLPLRNALRHTITTEPTSNISNNMPMIEILNPLEIYIEGKDNRADFTLGDDPTENFEHVADVDLILSKYGEDIANRLPGIANLKVTSVISGIRSLSMDSLPIIGPINDLDGYYNDCGWGGNGVSLSPIGGKLITEFITGSDNLPLNKDLFLLGRFK